MRTPLLRLVLPGAVALSLTACQRPAPPVVAAPPPSVAPVPPVQRFVTSTWGFHADDVCTATASHPALSLEITASSSKLAFTALVAHRIAMPANRAVPITFNGTSGSWTVTGHVASGHRVVASETMTEDEAGQILLLLQGGTITIGKRNDGLPILRVPNGGAPASDWFACVRRQLFP